MRVLCIYPGLMPVLLQQLLRVFFNEVPNMLTTAQQLLMTLPKKYLFISKAQVQSVVANINTELAALIQMAWPTNVIDTYVG